jgi:hypothetical protein
MEAAKINITQEQETITHFLRKWSTVPSIEGKSFDEIFSIEGIPLWWFYQRLFVGHVMPAQVNTFKMMQERIALTPSQKALFEIKSWLLPKYLCRREKRKIAMLKRKRTPTENEKVLLLTYSNHVLETGKIFRLQGIIDQLSNEKILEPCTVFVDPLSSNSGNKLQGLNSLYSYYDKEIEKRSRNNAFKMHERWKSITEEQKERMLLFEEESLWKYLRYSFNFVMSKEFLTLLYTHYELCKKIVREENIHSIVVTARNGIAEKCLLAAGHQARIPSVLVQHGVGQGTQQNLDLLGETVCAVFSDFYRQNLLRIGMEEKEIIVTGPVIFDELAQSMQEKEKRSEKYILCLTSPVVESKYLSEKEYFLRMENVLKGLNSVGVKLILKLHPREKLIRRYREMLEKIGCKEFIVLQHIPRKQYYDLLRGCSCFVNFNSTAAIESMIMDKPTVTIAIENSFSPFRQWIEDASVAVAYDKDITHAVTQAMLDEPMYKQKRKELVMKLCGNVDGKSSVRVVEYLYAVSGANKKRIRDKEMENLDFEIGKRD